MKKGMIYCGIALLIGALISTIGIPYYNSHKLIQVAGIALHMEEGDLVAEFELFQPDPENYLGKQKETVRSSGKDLEECIQNLAKTYGKELFLKDAAVLILAERDLEQLVPIVEAYYAKLKNNRMDLPVFFWLEEEKEVFDEDKVISLDIADGARMLHYNYTLNDLINQKGEPVYLKGEEGYEISKMR